MHLRKEVYLMVINWKKDKPKKKKKVVKIVDTNRVIISVK